MSGLLLAPEIFEKRRQPSFKSGGLKLLIYKKLIMSFIIIYLKKLGSRLLHFVNVLSN